MYNAQTYLSSLTDALKNAFGERLVYVGLQGSYLRGEATETSDIDPMVVIDLLTRDDLDTYHALIAQLPDPENSCGFICGRDELAHWNPLEISHLLHTTRDVYGSLAPLVPAHDERDLRCFIQLSIGNLYHELCHRYVHSDAETNRSMLPLTCKGVFFILQNLHHLRTGVFCQTKKDLLAQLVGDDHAVMQLAIQPADDFDNVFETLLRWCQQTLAGL